MDSKSFEDLLKKIEKIGRNEVYDIEAYAFILEALHQVVSKLDKPRHISGTELLQGIKDYAIKQFGSFTLQVFHHWGVRSTEDFGRMVFDLVDAELLRKQPEDKLEDFMNIYRFEDVFLKTLQFEDVP